VTDSLDVAVTALVGLLPDGDRYGAGLGVSRSIRVF
jgi:hypothetical protein